MRCMYILICLSIILILAAGYVYGLLIHSCFVDDGRGNRYDLINERGFV